ncbi:MAG: hypothetical protein WCA26_19925 [Xanthobacteraceae bacterium]
MTSPPSPAAERMRLHRNRRRQGMRCVQVSLHVTKIEALIRMGYLEDRDREDPAALETAINTFISDAVSEAQ